MKKKLGLILFWLCFSVLLKAQNNQILYGFDELPQTLMLNPGAEVTYDKHIGVPLLSNIFIQVGATNKNITYNNIYSSSDNYLDVLRNVQNQNLSPDDHFKIYQRAELLNVGFRLNNPKNYLSFGFYQEFDGFAMYPRDIAQLFFKGDDPDGDGVPNTNVPHQFNQLTVTGSLMGVLHIGLSKEINDKLTIGGRFKLMSSSLNIDIRNNKGSYSLDDQSAFYNHQFNNMNVNLNTSGLWNAQGNRVYDEMSNVIKGLFFINGNVGAGIDLGMTYHFDQDITLTASVLDLNYIKPTEDLAAYQIAEDFELPSPDYYQPTPNDELNYWENTLQPYYDAGLIPIDTLRGRDYGLMSTPKVFTGISKKFYHNGWGNKTVYRNTWCDPYDDLNFSDVLTSEVGLQTYTAFRPSKIVWGVTAFYSRELTQYLNAKVSYTVDQFSAKNIGLGLSTNIRRFNLFLSADNLLDLFQYTNSNYQSVQLGMNFKFY